MPLFTQSRSEFWDQNLDFPFHSGTNWFQTVRSIWRISFRSIARSLVVHPSPPPPPPTTMSHRPFEEGPRDDKRTRSIFFRIFVPVTWKSKLDNLYYLSLKLRYCLKGTLPPRKPNNLDYLSHLNRKLNRLEGPLPT